MTKPTLERYGRFIIYLLAWFAYILFAYMAFPVFSLTTMIMSIALTMLSAWLYGIPGCIITTILSVPFHYLVLRFYSDDPTMWMEALNPFGISTQLVTSGAVAIRRHMKLKIEKLNKSLEKTVDERTRELKRLQHYIVQNHETAQTLLSHMVLSDLGDSLMVMLCKSDLLLNHLVSEEDPTSARASKLHEMIQKSLDVVENLEFIDRYYSNSQISYYEAVEQLAQQFKDTAGVQFDLNINPNDTSISTYMQHQLYRITQEAITNAVRHGQASNIVIELDINNDMYRLIVSNDGTPLQPRFNKGLGLNLMQHRALQLNGGINLRKTEEGWTELSCKGCHVHD